LGFVLLLQAQKRSAKDISSVLTLQQQQKNTSKFYVDNAMLLCFGYMDT